MIYILIVFLILLLMISYYINNKDYLSPAFVFSLMFLMSVLDCAIYLPKWETTISFETALIIITGVLSFIIGTIIVGTYYNGRRKVIASSKSGQRARIVIPTWHLIVFGIFQLFISVMVLRQVVALTRPYVAAGGIPLAISTYQHLMKNTTLNLRFPTWLIYSSLITSSSGFFFGYVIAQNLHYRHKNGILLYANFFISAIGGILTGSRGNTLQMMMTAAFIFFFFLRNKKKKNAIKGKTVIKIITAAVILLYGFQFVAGLMGRSKGNSFGEYIAVYLGAPVKNLDLFITAKVTASTGQSETFLMQLNWWNSHFGSGSQNADFRLFLQN